MKKYHVHKIFNIQFIIAGYVFEDIASRVNDNDILSKEDTKTILLQLRGWEEEFSYLNLTFTLKYLKEIQRKMYPQFITFGALKKEIDILSDRIDHELEDMTFGFIPKDKGQYFLQDELFGKDVFDRFPSARQDIKDAGICFANELYTATVFHLMRVVEVGAKIMVSEMKAEKHITTPVMVRGVRKMVKKPVELCDWGTLIKGMETALRGLEQGTKISTKKKENLAFFSHALGVFRNFKDAWRNNVAHSRKDYLEGETKDIMENTRQFMQHLATKLEKKV